MQRADRIDSAGRDFARRALLDARDRFEPAVSDTVRTYVAAMYSGGRQIALGAGPWRRLGSSYVDRVSSPGRPAFLRTVRVRDDAPRDRYPFDLPAVARLDVALGAVTVLVGDNGSGKSTLIEAIAVAAGFNAEGGSRNLRFQTVPTHSDLHDHLELRWRQRPRWGWFLRAETFYGMASNIAGDAELARSFPDLHERSHGQSFLSLLDARFTSAGLYVMDEPESALSFQGQLQLLRLIRDGVSSGAQFVLATHSPILMHALDATIYELDDDGIHRVDYEAIAAVGLWRRFMDDPDPILHVLYDDTDS